MPTCSQLILKNTPEELLLKYDVHDYYLNQMILLIARNRKTYNAL